MFNRALFPLKDIILIGMPTQPSRIRKYTLQLQPVQGWFNYTTFVHWYLGLLADCLVRKRGYPTLQPKLPQPTMLCCHASCCILKPTWVGFYHLEQGEHLSPNPKSSPYTNALHYCMAPAVLPYLPYSRSKCPPTLRCLCLEAFLLLTFRLHPKISSGLYHLPARRLPSLVPQK